MRSFLVALPALPLLTGCSPALFGADWIANSLSDADGRYGSAGTGMVCMEASNIQPGDELEPGSFLVSGRVIADELADLDTGALASCPVVPGGVVAIEDDQGDVWIFGYSWMDDDGWDRTPWVDLAEDDRVEILYREAQDSDARGLVVSTDGQVRYAIEAGLGGQALRDGDLPGMNIADAGEVASAETECGTTRWSSLSFQTATDMRKLSPDGDTMISYNDTAYWACNINNVTVEDDCSDSVSTEVSWVVFR